MFLQNAWYVAGWSADLAPGEKIARRYLGQPIVLFRTATGRAAALEDRCCHRAVPLSAGQVDGEIIRCTYHGLEYELGGACVRIPSQDRIPAKAKVRSYPIQEQDALIWIWMGDPERADPAAIPRHKYHNDEGWAWRSDHYKVDGDWQLLIDNLMDLSHLPYIHPFTIGGNPAIHFRAWMDTKRTEQGVLVQRRMPDSDPPPTYVAAKGFQGRVDRWQEIEFMPVMLRIHTGACDVGTGAYEGRREHGFSMMGFHGITPETATTTHYFWSIGTNVLTDGVPDMVFQQTAATFKEDQVILELQQERLSETWDVPLIDIGSDAGGNLARRVIAELVAAETIPAGSKAEALGVVA